MPMLHLPMRRRGAGSIVMVALAALGVTAFLLAPATTASTANPYGLDDGPLAVGSVGALAWGPDTVLFVGDTAGGAVHAIETPAAPADSSQKPVKITGIDQQIATLLGTTADQIVIRDMKTHRASQQVYFSVMNGRGATATPALVRAAHDGTLTRVPLTDRRHATLAIANAPAADAKTPWGESSRALSITTLGYVENRVYIAGLSNEEFASDLRIAPFPFTGPTQTSSVEIFHTSHNRYETQAPIETFLPFSVRGTPSLLAGYGCAPLAAFRLSDFKNGAKVRGQTLAELGGGNRPLDMIAVQANGRTVVLIANSNRTLMRVSPADLDKATPITQGVDGAYISTGVPYVSMPIVGILQMDDFNADHIVLLQRDTETGSLDLKSFPKKWI